MIDMDVIKELREHILGLRRRRDRENMRWEALIDELNREIGALEEMCDIAEQEDEADADE
jgi:hypothetical protein